MVMVIVVIIGGTFRPNLFALCELLVVGHEVADEHEADRNVAVDE